MLSLSPQSHAFLAPFCQVMDVLRKTGPDGPRICNTVAEVLKHEVSWIAWKNDGCKDFTKQRDSAGMDVDIASMPEGSVQGRTGGVPKYKAAMGSKPRISRQQKLRGRQQRRKWERSWLNVPPRLRRDRANVSGLRNGEGREVPPLKVRDGHGGVAMGAFRIEDAKWGNLAWVLGPRFLSLD